MAARLRFDWLRLITMSGEEWKAQRRFGVARSVPRAAPLVAALFTLTAFATWRLARAADVDLARAEQLVREHHHQAAFELFLLE